MLHAINSISNNRNHDYDDTSSLSSINNDDDDVHTQQELRGRIHMAPHGAAAAVAVRGGCSNCVWNKGSNNSHDNYAKQAG